MYIDLTALAHEAMLEKGFQPDYSDEVLEELKLLNVADPEHERMAAVEGAVELLAVHKPPGVMHGYVFAGGG